MSFTQVTLKIGAGYRFATGAVASSQLRVTPLTEMTNGPTIVDQPVTVGLDADGLAKRTIAATTDPATTPVGAAYRIELMVGTRVLHTMLAQVPHNAGTVVDLTELIPVTGTPELPAPIVSTSGIQTINGEGPTGGNVVLSPSDIGAQPADVDLDALAALGDGVPVRASGAWTARTAASIRGAVSLLDIAPAGPSGGNDATTFAAAFTAAAAGTRRVYVPRMAAPWVIGTPITIPADLVIFGDGWGPRLTTPTIKLAAGLNDFAFKLPTTGADGNRVVVRDLEIDGNCGQQTAGGCFLATNAVQCEFDSVHFHHAYDVALHIWGQQGVGPYGHHVRVVNSLFDNSAPSAGNGQAIRIQSADEVTITGCDFENNGGAGAEPYHIKDWSGLNNIENNVFVGGGEGVRLQDCTGSRVIGNMFDGLNRDNVSMSGSSHVVSGNYFSGVGNTITPNTYRHLHINNGGAHTVSGNTFWTGGTTQGLRAVISHDVNASASTFTGNTLRTTAAVGDGGAFDYHGGSAAAQNLKLIGNTGFTDAGVAVASLAATGTASSTTYLRGDGAWATPAGSGGVAAGAITNTEVSATAAISADKLADGATFKVLTATERTKLGGIATGATANATDAQLRDRSTHTGTQAVSTLAATGTASATTFLRGDGAWAAPAGGGGAGLGANTFTGDQRVNARFGINTAPSVKQPVNLITTLNGGSMSGTQDKVAFALGANLTGNFASDTGSNPGFFWGLNLFATTGTAAGDGAGITDFVGGLIEASIQTPTGTTIPHVIGLQAEAAFFGATSGATVTQMESMRVSAPKRKDGSSSGSAGTAYCLFIEDSSAYNVGTGATRFSLFVEGGTSRFQGRVDIADTLLSYGGSLYLQGDYSGAGKIQLTTNNIGFFGVTPVARQTLPASGTVTAANIRTALIALGLCQ